MASEEKELFTIEELATKNEVNKSVLEGVKVMSNWRTGKKVTEKEFKANVTKFLKLEI